METPDFHTDFATDWKPKHSKASEETWIIRWTFLDHGEAIQYAVISECKVYKLGSVGVYEAAVRRDRAMEFARDLMEGLVASIGDKPLQGFITDNMTAYTPLPFRGPGGEKYIAIYSYRRVGIDSGMDTIVHPDNNLRMVLRHYRTTMPS